MFDSLTKVVDYLISLKKHRRDERREMFDNIFKPIFDELMIVHADYIEMFEEVILMLPGYDSKPPGSWSDREFSYKWGNREFSFEPPESNADKEKISKARDALKKNRRKFAPLRAKLQAFDVNELARDLPQEDGAFAIAVTQYFPNGQWLTRTSATKMIDRLTLAHCDSNIDIERIVLDTISAHNQKWVDVCETFAKLKVAVWRRQ